jgi:hypothetical protein
LIDGGGGGGGEGEEEDDYLTDTGVFRNVIRTWRTWRSRGNFPDCSQFLKITPSALRERALQPISEDSEFAFPFFLIHP